jgi:transposase
VCPHCGGHEYTIKQTIHRDVRHESMGLRACHLKLTAHRFKCKRCKKSFNERFDRLLTYQRATESFKEEVFHKHNQGITQRVLQKALHLGHSTIERWYHYMIQRKFKERKNNPAPMILGIDEHFFTKKDG